MTKNEIIEKLALHVYSLNKDRDQKWKLAVSKSIYYYLNNERIIKIHYLKSHPVIIFEFSKNDGYTLVDYEQYDPVLKIFNIHIPFYNMTEIKSYLKQFYDY